MGVLSKATQEIGANFIHISTDAFYSLSQNANTEEPDNNTSY